MEQQLGSTNTRGSQSKAIRWASMGISILFHPVFMPLLMSLAIYKLSPASFSSYQPKQLGLLFISIGISTLFFPLFTILLLKPLGFISSYHLEQARERTIPLLATMIFYFWISHVFNNIAGGGVPLPLKVLLLGNFWGIIGIFIANIFVKVSMHTAAAGGMIGIMIVMLFLSATNALIPLVATIILAGVVGSARLALGAHQRGDVWLGYLLGIVAQIGAFWYMK